MDGNLQTYFGNIPQKVKINKIENYQKYINISNQNDSDNITKQFR